MTRDPSVDIDHLVGIALDDPDEEGDCLRCACSMSRPEPELEPTPLCPLCAQAALAILAREVRRLRARDAAWQRATRVDDPARVGERNVRLCSCDGADLPQVGDEIDACETCDGLVRAPGDEGVDVQQIPAPSAQWISRAARCQPATDAQTSREPNDAGGGP
jgi:hypothetical protein